MIRDTSWKWDGESWRRVEAQTGPTRTSHVAFPHPSGAGITFFGGLATSGSFDDIWHLTYFGANASYEACVDTTNLDGDDLGGCDDPDCWHVCTPLSPPGATCDPDAPSCGDDTCNDALENCRICPGDCGECTPVCGDFVCDPDETAATCPGDCTGT